MPKFTKIERPSTPREAYELLRSSKTACVMGGGLWMRLQHRTIPCAIDLSACGLDQIEESDDAFVIGAGAKQSGCCEVFAAFVALKTGRPAKCLYTREETFASSNSRHQMVMDVRVGARKDGSITAIDLYALSNAGA